MSKKQFVFRPFRMKEEGISEAKRTLPTTATSSRFQLYFTLTLALSALRWNGVASSKDSGMSVLEFSPTGDLWSSTSQLVNNPMTLPDLQAFTMCYRLKVYRFWPTIYWLNVATYSIANDDTCCEMRSLWTGLGPIFVIRNNFVAISRVEVKVMRWYHHCFAYNVTNGQFAMYLDGSLLEEGQSSSSSNITFLKGNGSLHLGSNNECGWLERENCTGQFSGQITDLNIWKRVLSEKELMEFTTGKEEGSGDVLNWRVSQWKHHNINHLQLSIHQIREEREDSYMVFSELREYFDSYSFCKSFGCAEMAAPASRDEMSRLWNVAKPFLDDAICPTFSLGWMDQHTEGTFVNMNRYHDRNRTEQPLPKELTGAWDSGEPNGGKLENCVALRPNGKWNDMPCEKETKACTICYFQRRPLFTLRGLCKSTNIDQRYILTATYHNSKPIIQGYYGIAIRWLPFSEERSDGNWHLTSVVTDESHGKLLSKSSTSYPLGRQEWALANDLCNSGENHTLNLTLTACGEGMYTCDNGDCVPLEQRCNTAQNCEDGSDEIECTILHIPSGYRQASPPPPRHVGKPIQIEMEVFIIAYSEIDVNKMKMTVDFILNFSWFDSRLSFHNLKESFSLNSLSLAEMQQLWFPEITFTNTRGNQLSILDESTETYVLKRGAGVINGIEDNREKMIFSGHENPLVSQRKYTIDFTCAFELRHYPFDVQRCPVSFQLKRPTRQEAVLVLEKVVYEGGEDLLEYRVRNTSTRQEYACGQEDAHSCTEIWVTLKRRVGNQLLNTYLPTGCLLLIISLTHYFKLNHYDTRIMVGLTGMLVIASLFVSTSASLPKTSYMKMIDIWMIFCFLLPFFEVILHTLVEYCTEDEMETAAHNYNMAFESYYFCRNHRGGPFDPLDNNRRCSLNKQQRRHQQQQKNSSNSPISRRRSGNGGGFPAGTNFPPLSVERAKKPLGIQSIIDYFARVFVPTVIIIFNLCYWGMALRQGGIEI